MKNISASIIVGAILGTTSVVATGTAATALPYPGNCSVRTGNTGVPQGFAVAKCTTGGGSYRVVVKCSFYGQTPGTHYGPWVGIGQESKQYCPPFQLATSASYQRTT